MEKSPDEISHDPGTSYPLPVSLSINPDFETTRNAPPYSHAGRSASLDCILSILSILVSAIRKLALISVSGSILRQGSRAVPFFPGHTTLPAMRIQYTMRASRRYGVTWIHERPSYQLRAMGALGTKPESKVRLGDLPRNFWMVALIAE